MVVYGRMVDEWRMLEKNKKKKRKGTKNRNRTKTKTPEKEDVKYRGRDI